MNDKIKQLLDTKTVIKKEIISLNKLLAFYRECYKNAKIDTDFNTVILSASIIFTICNNIKSLQESYRDTCNELIEEYTQEIISIQNKEINLIDELNKLYNIKDEINQKIVLIRREVSEWNSKST
jgi:uncharacterized coiled-coil DUF342 family protein